MTAPGELPLDAVAAHLRACDVVVQPYPDGATTRRTTLMAALANGVPTVTTAGGHSEPFWATTDAVAVAPAGNADRIAAAAFGLLDDPDARRTLGTRGRELYDREFAPARTVDALLARDRS